MLDAAASGPLWLKDPEIAGIVDRTIRRGAELAHFVLRAYVIMPNHVHLLLEPCVILHKLTGGIKGVSAHDANAKLGRTGNPFWQDESFDHWIRNPGQFARMKALHREQPGESSFVRGTGRLALVKCPQVAQRLFAVWGLQSQWQARPRFRLQNRVAEIPA